MQAFPGRGPRRPRLEAAVALELDEPGDELLHARMGRRPGQDLLFRDERILMGAQNILGGLGARDVLRAALPELVRSKLRRIACTFDLDPDCMQLGVRRVVTELLDGTPK